MTREVWLLLSATVLFAAWFVAWLVLIVRSFKSSEVERPWLSLLPPAAPFVAWKGGSRVAPLAFIAFGAGYVVIRLVIGS